MDFVTGLPVSIDWKGDNYDSILVIVDWLIMMVYYILIKIIFNAPRLAEVIIDMVVRHYRLLDSIITNIGSFFTSKFWLLLCYFLGIKRRLFTTFYPQTNGQTEQKPSTIVAYLQVSVNFEQNDWARLLVMAKFAYNNAKNLSIGHIPFELNCGYHPLVCFKKDIDPHSWSKSIDKLLAELQDLMIVCRENLQHAEKFQKRVYNGGIKPKSYTPSDKVWLNSKYIKTKCNRKLKAKFFGPFRVLHLIRKQAYKLELPKWWKMHDVFHILLLEQDSTRKERVNKQVTESELKARNSEEYKVKAILDTAVYASKLESGQLQSLYYLVE